MKPAIFIASSSESLDLASAVQESLESVGECTVWNQDVFKLSRYNIESLIDALEANDFGVFIFTPEDVTSIRGESKLVVRDNVIFELGLFIGKLGRERCFIVAPRGSEDNFHLPTDLLGITPALYEPDRQDKNLVAALGPATTKIARQVRSLSKKPSNEASVDESVVPLSEGDVMAILQSWMGSRPASLNTEVIYFADVDKELKLPTGSAKKHLSQIATRWDYVPSQQGEATILFTEKPRQRTRVHIDDF